MKSLEQRIQKIEDQQALQNVITDYLVAVDDLSDIEAVLSCFTSDATFDMSGINYPTFEGHGALRLFSTEVFSSMSHHAHYATNFKIDSLTQDNASARTHVIGMGVTNGGEDVLFYLQYHLDYQRTQQGWKISSFRGHALLPIT